MKTMRPMLAAMVAAIASLPTEPNAAPRSSMPPPTPSRRPPPNGGYAYPAPKPTPHEPTPAELRAQAKRNRRALRNLRNEKRKP